MVNVCITIFLPLLFLQAGGRLQAGGPSSFSGASVIFFSPPRAERDSIAQAEGLEIDDILDDFQYASGKAAVYLGTHRIPVAFTSDARIVVKLRNGRMHTFDRRTVSGLVGMILTDGLQEPRLVAGVAPYGEVVSQIDAFFHLK